MFAYYAIIALQIYCFYHAYTNRVDIKWYLLIFFLPFIGCTIYLYYHFYNRQNVKAVTRGVESIINTNSEIQRLEKQMEFSDTIQNKTLVADKYMEIGRYQEAIDLYESCLEGFNENDPKTIKKLSKAYYQIEDYEKSVFYGNKVKDDPYFVKSEDAIYYAWSLNHTGSITEAEALFDKMDVPFSNYIHRMEYAKFLYESGKRDEALSKLEEMIEEYNHVESIERRQIRATMRDIKQLHKEFQTQKEA